MAMHPADIAREIKTFEFFKAFEDHLILQISTMITIQDFKAGSHILVEGEQNDSLFFLRSGRVWIMLEGEKLAELDKTGEVLGEMSVISTKPVAASIKAMSDVSCFKVRAKDFENVLPTDRDRFQFLIYKIYCHVMTERLLRTNEKARRFEIAHRDLEKAKKDLEELTQAKMDSIQHDILMPLKSSLEQIQTEIEELSKLGRSELVTPLAKIQEILKPISQLNKSEQAISSKKVLLIDTNKKNHLIAKTAVGGTGVKLDVSVDENSARDLLAQKNYDLVLFDIEFTNLAKDLYRQGVTIPFVMMTSFEIQSFLNNLKDLSFINHVISRDSEDRMLAVKTILTTITKIINKDYFGMEKYLAWGVELKSRRIQESSKRAENIDEMLAELKSLGIRSAILDRCQLVAEEMLMNAIYDAPCDKDGKSLFNHLGRNQNITLEPAQAATLSYACDGMLIAVSVADPFGGLKKSIITSYLESCYTGNAGSLNQGKGGAGRGLHQIIENSDITIFNVKSGKKTEVICLFHIDPNMNKKAGVPTFHYFFS